MGGPKPPFIPSSCSFVSFVAPAKGCVHLHFSVPMPTTDMGAQHEPGPLRAHLPGAPHGRDARSTAYTSGGQRTELRPWPPKPKTAAVGRRVVSTGSAEIDKKMGGGIPEGSLILIEGSSNAGKSVVTQQLTLRRAQQRLTLRALHDREHASQPLPPDGQPEPRRHGLLPARRASTCIPCRRRCRRKRPSTAFHKLLDHLGQLRGKFDFVFIDSHDVVRLAGAGVGRRCSSSPPSRSSSTRT